ncbi:hypothetical protein R1flu_013640 [Riccia fluitans]|uniref:Programmed cell death protein 2 C-terminal domain-containing protein n=1 Tax=Riccia fluitans TaxID=41844 RepID=A0ABD1YDT9_9MARC
MCVSDHISLGCYLQDKDMGRPLPGHTNSDNKEVSLGLPGAWADESNELADHYTTKVGGQPDWPGTLVPLIKSDQLKCGSCGGYLSLVTQVHAPLTSDGLNFPERTLYILGCPAQGCGISQTSWRTIRVQKNTLEDPAPEIEGIVERAESNDSSRSGAPDPIDLEWGGTSRRQDEDDRTQGDWWGDNPWDLPVEESSYEIESMNLQELQSSLTEAARVAATVPGTQNRSNTRRLNPGTVVRRNPDRIILPVLSCFYIYTQAESTGVGPSTSGTHPQRDLQTLGENEGPGDENEDSGEMWGSEDYEPDQALYADRTYLKFKKKLDYHPEQCFRYSFGGRPLYATDERSDPANCTACGGPRVFEVQLMPPLLYYLQQAHRDLPPTSYGPEDWEWHTVLVFSCAQSCIQEESQQLTVLGEKTDWSFIEEATILQQDLSAAFVR